MITCKYILQVWIFSCRRDWYHSFVCSTYYRRHCFFQKSVNFKFVKILRVVFPIVLMRLELRTYWFLDRNPIVFATQTCCFLLGMLGFWLWVSSLLWLTTAAIYLLKVNNRNTRARREICSKLTVKTHQWHRSDTFIVNFEHISHLFLVFWTCNCRLERMC